MSGARSIAPPRASRIARAVDGAPCRERGVHRGDRRVEPEARIAGRVDAVDDRLAEVRLVPAPGRVVHQRERADGRTRDVRRRRLGGYATPAACGMRRSDRATRLRDRAQEARHLEAAHAAAAQHRLAHAALCDGLAGPARGSTRYCPRPSAVVCALPSRAAERKSTLRSPGVKTGAPGMTRPRSSRSPPGCLQHDRCADVALVAAFDGQRDERVDAAVGRPTVSRAVTVPSTMASAARASARSLMATNVVAPRPARARRPSGTSPGEEISSRCPPSEARLHGRAA